MSDVGPGLRVFPELRAAHVEDSGVLPPRRTLFFAAKYDLGSSALPAYFEQVGLRTAAVALWRSPETTLELPEPLWIRFFPRWLLLASTWKLRGGLRRKQSRIVFYAIENNAVETVLMGGRGIPRWLRWTVEAALGVLVDVFTTKCAYGTHGSAAAYGPIFKWRRPPSRVVEDLLSRRVSRAPVKTPLAALFVGALERRKGIPALLAAWPEVEAAIPQASLTIIGIGPLGDQVQRWANEDGTRRRHLGFVTRADVLELLSAAAVLVAPSVPDGRWREQVGRPIHEALAVGTTVVTTDQTGLAEVLVKGGHRVVPVGRLEEALAATIIDALEHPVPVADVLDELPSVDGRWAADLWLHS